MTFGMLQDIKTILQYNENIESWCFTCNTGSALPKRLSLTFLIQLVLQYKQVVTLEPDPLVRSRRPSKSHDHGKGVERRSLMHFDARAYFFSRYRYPVCRAKRFINIITYEIHQHNAFFNQKVMNNMLRFRRVIFPKCIEDMSLPRA